MTPPTTSTATRRSGIVAANAATAMASLTFNPADIGVPAQTADGAQMPPFLVKLWHLVLTVPTDVGRWSADGSRFEVVRPKPFSELVLREFRGEGASGSADALLRVMNTFTRQLHFYSFRRNELHGPGYNAGAWAFQHPSFEQGHPEKLAFIRRFSRASDRDRIDPALAAAVAGTPVEPATTIAGSRRPSRASARRARKRVARYDDSSDESDAYLSSSDKDAEDDDDGDVTDADEDSEYGTRHHHTTRASSRRVPGASAPTSTSTSTPSEKRQRVAVAPVPVPMSPPVPREPAPSSSRGGAFVEPAPEPFWVVSETPSGVRLHDEMPSLGYLSEDIMSPSDDSAGVATELDHDRVLRRYLEADFAPLVTPKAGLGNISWGALPSSSSSAAPQATSGSAPTATTTTATTTVAAGVTASPPKAPRAPLLDSSFGWFPDAQQQWPTSAPTPVSRSTSAIAPGEDLDLVVEALT